MTAAADNLLIVRCAEGAGAITALIESSQAPGVIGLPRIGLVTFDFYPSIGGQGRHTYELWRHLRALSVDIAVLSPRRNALAGHTRRGAFASGLARGIGFSIYAGATLRRWALESGVALLHLNGGPGGVLMLTPPAQPLLYTAHHTDAQQARLPGQSWKAPLAALEGRGYRAARAVVADTPSTAASVANELRVAHSKVAVIPSGFDPARFRPLGLERTPDTALYVGRLDARKGFLFLLRAWREVVARRRTARLFVIGSGPLQRKADEYLASHGIADSVIFLGRQSEEELARWYNRVRVVAVPSVFEGFGLVALEAIGCGTRVVATDVDGLRDVIKRPEHGTLAPYGDKDAFAQALLSELTHPSALSAGTVADVSSSYSWPVIAARYARAYERALESAT
jgi:glycosyltransferase involved in cell wall biosynthesis